MAWRGKSGGGTYGWTAVEYKKVTASKRIDFVFSRGLTPVSVEILPMQPSASTSAESILWSSNHLGVVAELK
jgi:endonuclease/exonuclease/phosphatase (EEP) superfamily protein YafD